jgi:hypothetical protein
LALPKLTNDPLGGALAVLLRMVVVWATFAGNQVSQGISQGHQPGE